MVEFKKPISAPNITTLTNRVSATEANGIVANDPRLLLNWNSQSTYRFFPNQATVFYTNKLWQLMDVDGAVNQPPPGPFRTQLGDAIYTMNPAIDSGTVDSNALHGACFRLATGVTITQVGLSLTTANATYAGTVNVWVRLLSSGAPIEGTDTPSGSLVVLAGDIPTKVVLTTPMALTAGVDYVVWYGPTGGALTNLLKTTDTIANMTVSGSRNGLTAPTVQYVTRPSAGVLTNQPGKYIQILLYEAGLTQRCWVEPALTDRALSTIATTGASINHNPALYRRSDFTLGTVATQITLINPTAPAVGEVLPSCTILLSAVSGPVPGAVTWVNLTGGSTIPTLTAGQIIAATLEWVNNTTGWLVVGVRG